VLLALPTRGTLKLKVGGVLATDRRARLNPPGNAQETTI